jgi:hypothetical protein
MESIALMTRSERYEPRNDGKQRRFGHGADPGRERSSRGKVTQRLRFVLKRVPVHFRLRFTSSTSACNLA